jgi:hypothetical protein
VCRARSETEANLGDTFLSQSARRLRDRALFDLAIDSKLRGCDLVQKSGTWSAADKSGSAQS